ncbi:MAG: polysaccharide biosynthesis tyrosine autokinase [Pirellulaceae bacterium]|nr:polysaccharide biosynthesis tyrosine autokinase [Pirellulaceae bacterium]
MSQIMESMLNRGLTSAAPEVVAAPQQQNMDLVRVLWRWKWLPILGALIGAGVGYMFYTKVPEKFQSFAMVQVVSAIPAGRGFELYDHEKVAAYKSRHDESRVIKSQKVLGMAVKNGNLAKHFPGMTENQIVFELMDQRRGVEVSPAEKSDKVVTDQLVIAYVSRDPDVAQAVVNAVVAGYQAFLSEEFKTVDDEVLKFFTRMESKLREENVELDARYAKFKQEAMSRDILWHIDSPVDPFFESYRKKENELDQIISERITLKSELEVVESLMKSETARPHDILMMLNDRSDLVKSTFWRQIFEDPSFKGGDLESVKMERALADLLAEEEYQISSGNGPSHPMVKRVRAQIQATEAKIAKAKEAERDAQVKALQARLKTRQAMDGKKGADEEAVGAEVDAEAVAAEADAANKSAEMLLAESESSDMAQTNQFLEMTINALQARYRALATREAEVRAMAEADRKKSIELTGFMEEHLRLRERIGDIKQLYSQISDKLKAVELAPSNVNQKILKELNPASGGLFYGPYPAPYTLGGAAVGILLMSGLAILMDLADRSYRSPDEIVSDLGKPVLGHIPAMDLANIKKVIDSVDPSIITLHHSRGRISEAFRSVRTGLFFSSRGSELKVVQITSPVPGDGKSTLSSNLAVAMAQSGRRVLLIDADFRRPRLQKLFGFDADVGMAQLVAGQCELDDAIYTSCVANLSIMPGGKRPNNPAELLSSSRFAELIEIVREKYDIIIIDTPPLLAVSDPSVVASVVDGVVLTMRLRRNVKPLATRAFRVLESVDAQILGVVVNGVSTEAAYGGYGYNYSYNDYRYSYRSSYGYGYGKYGKYGYGKYGKYTSYTTGYIEDKQSEAAEVTGPKSNDANTQS